MRGAACHLRRNRRDLQLQAPHWCSIHASLPCIYTWILRDPRFPSPSTGFSETLPQATYPSVLESAVQGPPSLDSSRESPARPKVPLLPCCLGGQGPEHSIHVPLVGWEQGSGHTLGPCHPREHCEQGPYTGLDRDAPTRQRALN